MSANVMGANYNSMLAGGQTAGMQQNGMPQQYNNGSIQGYTNGYHPSTNGYTNGINGSKDVITGSYGEKLGNSYGGNNGHNGGNNGFAGGNYGLSNGTGGLNGTSFGQNNGYDGYYGAFDYEGGDAYEYGFYPRYSQGSGPEYAQNNLQTTQLEEGLEVTVYGEAGEEIPAPVDSWDAAQTLFPPVLVQECRRNGFERPMPIQANTWGIGVMGRDIIGVAKTGSGKTLAYLFLGFMRLSNAPRSPSPGMLIMAPTRELVQQIEAESVKFGRPLNVRTASCYGGASRGPQLGQIRRGAKVLVATPGRLNDFLQAGQVNLSHCSFLVLDEADRMLDLGFEPQIRTIIKCLPSEQRQTLLYTATWPKELRSLASDFLKKPIHVHVGHGDHLAANKDITQIVLITQNEQEKMEELRRVLSQCQQGDRVLIFCETKASTAYLSQQLTQVERVNAVAIHGDLAQNNRDWSLESFKSGRAPIMVATDVAGRGLDIKGITAVVNWDPAHNAEDYVHRIGRTARAGCKGVAYTFLLPGDTRKAKDIVNVMENTGLQPAPELLQLAGRGQRNFKGKGKKGKGKGKGFSGKGKGGGGFRGGKGKSGGAGRFDDLGRV